MTITDTYTVQTKDAAHYLHPFTNFKTLAQIGSRVIVRGEGIYIWDSDGNRLIDGMSGLWCVNVGYGRKELADAASRQMQELPFYNSFFQTTNVPAVTLAEMLVEISPPQFQHVFFAGSGSEANDTIIRMVRRYWDLCGQPDRQVIISRMQGYHGSTMGGASLSGMSWMHAQGGLPIPGIVHIREPYYYGHGGEMTREEFGLTAARWLEEKILAIGPDKVAAFIGEPVQGAGGVIIPPSTYWPEIQRICNKYDILLVTDEVVCGFGRLGHWFGCEYFGVSPDLMTFAKGVTSGYIPMGGVMVGNRVADVLIEKGGEFNHGYTYCGHPVACAVAIENINLMRREKLVERVRDDIAPYFARAFEELADHPLVGAAEACGLTAGLILVKDKANKTLFPSELDVGMVCRGHMFGNGMIMRAVGDRMILAPPLITTPAQIDEMINLIRHCLDLTYEDIKKQA